MAGSAKAVLDTQIVVRGLARLRPASSAVQVFEQAMTGRFSGVTSPLLLGEVRQVLRIARTLTHWTDDEIQKAVDHITKRLIVVPGHLSGLRQIVPENAKDNPLFEAALESAADFVISDDAAVLNAKSVLFAGRRPIEVIAPGPFLKFLGR